MNRESTKGLIAVENIRAFHIDSRIALLVSFAKQSGLHSFEIRDAFDGVVIALPPNLFASKMGFTDSAVRTISPFNNRRDRSLSRVVQGVVTLGEHGTLWLFLSNSSDEHATWVSNWTCICLRLRLGRFAEDVGCRGAFTFCRSPIER